VTTWNRIAFVAAILLLTLGIARIACAGGGERQVCDVGADYALGVENYSEAIRLHAEVVRKHPDNALAHYHLGFAQGMTGNRTAEVSEYQRAAALGLRNWDLFLNLGLAQLENGELDAATDNLRQAVLLDARNSLGVIYAEEGKTVRASMIWGELVREVPDYQPARTNLKLMGNRVEAARGETAAVVPPPPAAAVKAIEDERKLHSPTLETELTPGPALRSRIPKTLRRDEIRAGGE
jgi:tetratricopeptide (TPR) repeat protein